MSDIIPPAPVDAPFGSYNWSDWYEKVRRQINQATTVAWSIVTGTPTTIAGYGITDAYTKTQNDTQDEQKANKNAVSGYAGLNAVSRTTKGVDTTDYIVVDSTTNGFTMKSPNGHYWVATISNAGVVTWTDVGTTKP
jgi:hypothetical protein